MQEHTSKEQDFSKARRTSPIHIVDGGRAPATNVDALREAQISLVRAEQNLYNLVQAGQVANAAQFGGAAFGYPAQAFPSAYGATGFAPAFASPAMASPVSAAFGMASGLTPWGTVAPTAMTPWSQLANGIVAAPGALSSASIWAPGAYTTSVANRTPACDISDEGKQFVCTLELPGLRADQVELLCFERAVIISAYREVEGDIASVVQSERGNATQQRTITLPNEIQPGGAKATLNNGILTVVLPKAHPTEGPRRIKVQG